MKIIDLFRLWTAGLAAGCVLLAAPGSSAARKVTAKPRSSTHKAETKPKPTRKAPPKPAPKSKARVTPKPALHVINLGEETNKGVALFRQDKFLEARDQFKHVLSLVTDGTPVSAGMAHYWLALTYLDGREAFGTDKNAVREMARREVIAALSVLPNDAGQRRAVERLRFRLFGYPRVVAVVADDPGSDDVARDACIQLRSALTDWDVRQLDSKDTASSEVGFVLHIGDLTVDGPRESYVKYKPGGKRVKGIFGRYTTTEVPAHYTYRCNASLDLVVSDNVQNEVLVHTLLSSSYSTPNEKYDDTADNARREALASLASRLADTGPRKPLRLLQQLVQRVESESTWWRISVKDSDTDASDDLYRVANTTKREIAYSMPYVLLVPAVDQTGDGESSRDERKSLSMESEVLPAVNEELRRMLVDTGEVSLVGYRELELAGIKGLNAKSEADLAAFARTLPGCKTVIVPKILQAWYDDDDKVEAQVAIAVHVINVASGNSEPLNVDPKKRWKDLPLEAFVGNEKGGDSRDEVPTAVDDAIHRCVVWIMSALLPRVATPPSKPTVQNEKVDDSTLRATFASQDPESGVVEYAYAIGTDPEWTPETKLEKDWRTTPLATVTVPKLRLKRGRTYFWYVKARNAVDLDARWGHLDKPVQLWSDVGVSNGITP